ncbi:MAG: histidine phosphatase family protein, partial [Chthoniobacterales bacterium]
MKSSLLVFLLASLFASTVVAQSTIFIVRHAEKAPANITGSSAADPELSAAGRTRAEILARMLRDAGLTAVYATEYKRTQQTAAPAAKAAGVDVTVISANALDSLVAKLKQTHGNALVVGHSNTIPAIIKGLDIRDSVSLSENDYDSLFLVRSDKQPELLLLHYW